MDFDVVDPLSVLRDIRRRDAAVWRKKNQIIEMKGGRKLGKKRERKKERKKQRME